MNCFFIDYENESGRALAGISLLNLRAEDELIFFYTQCASRIDFEILKELEKTPAKKRYLKAETGNRNSLDFQLVSYLGACIHKNPEKNYYIVSKDKGYECVCRFWRDKNVFVKRIEYFSAYANTNKPFL